MVAVSVYVPACVSVVCAVGKEVESAVGVPEGDLSTSAEHPLSTFTDSVSPAVKYV